MDNSVIGILISLVSLAIAIAGTAWARRGAEAAASQATSAAEQTLLTQQQLDLIQKKIGMVTDPKKMSEILPIWYISRMGKDNWGFGLLLNSGVIVAISQITGLSDNGQWLEVDMLGPDDSGPRKINAFEVLYAPTKDRLSTSVQIASIEAAFELWTS